MGLLSVVCCGMPALVFSVHLCPHLHLSWAKYLRRGPLSFVDNVNFGRRGAKSTSLHRSRPLKVSLLNAEPSPHVEEHMLSKLPLNFPSRHRKWPFRPFLHGASKSAFPFRCKRGYRAAVTLKCGDKHAQAVIASSWPNLKKSHDLEDQRRFAFGICGHLPLVSILSPEGKKQTPSLAGEEKERLCSFLSLFVVLFIPLLLLPHHCVLLN